MALTANQLRPQIDLPVWEWCRACPTVAVTGQSCSATPDNSNFNTISGRYIYYLASTSTFYRYDTITDTWEVLTGPAAPANPIIVAGSMKFAGAQGYYGRIISGASSSIVTGVPFGRSAVGYNIRILSGKGAGQERIITDISDPVVADYGNATAGTNLLITDANKGWQDTIPTVTIAGGTTTVSASTTVNLAGGGTTSGLHPGMTVSFIVGNGSGSIAAATTISTITSGTSFTISASSTFTCGTTSYLIFTAPGVNKWIGYVVRTIIGTGPVQFRKILYNNATSLTVSDVNFAVVDPWANTPMATAPAAGTIYQIESSTITVDTAWDVVPDNTSRFVIQSGGIWILSNATAAPFYTLQYYDVLADTWYAKPALTNNLILTSTEVTLEKQTENASIWEQSIALGTHSTTTLQDTTNNWTTNQWAGYQLFIYSGTGRGQLTTITSNDSNKLTFPTLGTAPDNTSRYRIKGFDGGTASSATYTTLVDSTKTWTTNRWTNYAVRIVAGTGIGQLRQIASNTGTAITTYMSWNIQPDNTSKYVIQGFSDALFFSVATATPFSAELFVHQAGDIDTLSHGRVLDQGWANQACALLCDSSHTIYEQPPTPISTIGVNGSGATGAGILITTAINHNLKAGQYISLRGIASSGTAADVYNATGLFQIVTATTSTTFTIVPVAPIVGALTLLAAQSTTALTDASKFYADVATGGSTTSVTFTKATPSNINGWYISGTNVGGGTGQSAQITSGAGTTSLVITTGTGTPTGLMTITKYPQPVMGTWASGGALNSYTVTLTGNANTLGASLVGYSVGHSALGCDENCTVVSYGGGAFTLSTPFIVAGGAAQTYYFYPPNNAVGNYLNFNTGAAPAITTGLAAGAGGNIAYSDAPAKFFPTTPFLATPVNGVTRYVIAKPTMIGAATDQLPITLISGLASAGGTTGQLVDISAYMNGAPTATPAPSTNTSPNAAGQTQIALSAVSPPNCTGWYVGGTGVAIGARVVSGAGTNTLTLDTANVGIVSGTITVCAWGSSGATSPLVGRKIKIYNGATGNNVEPLISAVAPATGTITFAVAVAAAPLIGATYSILSLPVKGLGHQINWVYGNSIAATKGKYLVMNRGTAVGFDKIDMTTDKVILSQTTPNSAVANLTTNSMQAYDGVDRIYYTKDTTQLCYYLDANTWIIHGAGMYPYAAPAACLGNRMEVFTTADGLKYLWMVRGAAVETFRQLLFY